MFFDVCAIFINIFVLYVMDYSGVLDVNNATHLFTLHLIFIPMINQALAEFRGIQ